nr:MAG TPA: hypothetical protein [Caudoviricetes sp.]
MLKEFVEKLEQMAQKENTQLFDIHDRKYCSSPLYEIKKLYDTPTPIAVNTLESLSDIIKTELGSAYKPLFVNVQSPTKVEVFSPYHFNEDCRRDYLYIAQAELPRIALNDYLDHESFMIALRSKFVENDDVSYLLDLLSKISDEDSVESEDNGISQTVRAKKGVVLVENVIVRSKVKLAPFRTFLEVEQPESEFLLRLQEGGRIGLFEADGGAWKLDAKENIKDLLMELLREEIGAKKVVVIA